MQVGDCVAPGVSALAHALALQRLTESQTWQALNTLQVQRRVILTGTPIQNDLTEYFALISFAIPNIFGDKNAFRKKYQHIIMRGRDADATDKERAECDAKLKEMGEVVSKFIIRRTNDLLSKYCGSTA